MAHPVEYVQPVLPGRIQEHVHLETPFVVFRGVVAAGKGQGTGAWGFIGRRVVDHRLGAEREHSNALIAELRAVALHLVGVDGQHPVEE